MLLTEVMMLARQRHPDDLQVSRMSASQVGELSGLRRGPVRRRRKASGTSVVAESKCGNESAREAPGDRRAVTRCYILAA